MLDKDYLWVYNVLNKQKGGTEMPDKEKDIIAKIADNLKYMDEEDKTILVEKADSMAYMNRKWKRKLGESAAEKSV